MWSYALHRIAAALVTLAFASVIIFFFIHLIPGDPLYVLLGDVATPEQVEALRHKLGARSADHRAIPALARPTSRAATLATRSSFRCR